MKLEFSFVNVPSEISLCIAEKWVSIYSVFKFTTSGCSCVTRYQTVIPKNMKIEVVSLQVHVWKLFHQNRNKNVSKNRNFYIWIFERYFFHFILLFFVCLVFAQYFFYISIKKIYQTSNYFILFSFRFFLFSFLEFIFWY